MTRVLVWTCSNEESEALVKNFDDTSIQVTTAESEAHARQMLADGTFALAIIRWSQERQKFDLNHSSFHKPQWSVALIPADVENHDGVFSLGYDACASEGCGPQELMTHLNRAKSIEALEARLSQASKLESIGQLAAGIAHEINTPIQYVGDNTRFVHDAYESLCGIISQVEQFLEEPAVDECGISEDACSRSRESLRRAIQESDFAYLSEEVPLAIEQSLQGIQRVAQIVRAMKEFAHPGEAHFVVTDLSSAIENTLTVARNEWKYVAEAETRFDPALPLVPCMPGDLNQVLLNLVVNAAHAISDALGDSPTRKGKITITTRLARPNAEIWVQDTGVGIPKENLSKVFAPFFTTKPPGRGTGQGLAIAHNVIVEKHGGSIHVESKVGAGTKFILRLPLESRIKSGMPLTSPEAVLTV